ncbi:MAG: prepilin-type N-terminal cleavage/methylation domain-containing protein [Longimicrobiales bacterium]
MLTHDTAPEARRARSGGFTLVEVTIALVILAVAVLGMAASAGVLGRYSAEAEVRALAMQAVQDRISLVKVDPRYGELETLYAGSESDLPGLDGFTRTTTVTRVNQTVSGGGTLDYKVISVVVTGDVLSAPLSRRFTVGAP